MYRTIRELLPLTTLGIAQVNRNYYRVKDQYEPLGLIYKDEDNTRWVHKDAEPSIITRRRKRKFIQDDIDALMYTNWSYFGTYCPEDKVNIEHCKAVMVIVFNHLSTTHDGKVKLIYFIENPDTNIHVHFLLQIEDYTNLKKILENKFRVIIKCNTLVKVYDPTLSYNCKNYITKDLLKYPNTWGMGIRSKCWYVFFFNR